MPMSLPSWQEDVGLVWLPFFTTPDRRRESPLRPAGPFSGPRGPIQRPAESAHTGQQDPLAWEAHMSHRAWTVVIVLLAALVVSGGLVAVGALGFFGLLPVVAETIEKTEYHPPPPDPWQELTDDRIEDKNPAFDPGLVDRRKLGDWLVNSSAAVLRLDVVAAKPDQDAA